MSEVQESVEAVPASPAPKSPTTEPEGNPYAPGRLFAVAVLGAGCSLAAYYLFQQMDPESRRRLKGKAVRNAKAQVRNWVGSKEDESSEALPVSLSESP